MLTTERPNEAASPQAAVLGTLAWLGLFVYLAVVSPWMVVFVVGLAASIMLHEVGHFWTARRSGMEVTQFFLGFGPRIWSFHRGGVEYGVRALPLGGFVKITGMTNLDEVAPEVEPRTYRQATFPRRMWVITAGSVMHVVIALVTIGGVYSVWGRVEETGRVTLGTVQADSPADTAGLAVGDVVLAIDGRPITTSSDLNSTLGALLPGDEHILTIERDGSSSDVVVRLGQHPEYTEVRGYLGVRSSSTDRVRQSIADTVVEGPSDLVVGIGQAAVGITKVLNPVNVLEHLLGTSDDPTTRPGTIVGATRLSDDAGRFDGWAGVLSLLAAVNISVGVFNMFPLLPLDGGHAAIAVYERVRSRRGLRYRADVSKLTPIAAICIALLAFMFLTGLYLDTVQL